MDKNILGKLHSECPWCNSWIDRDVSWLVKDYSLTGKCSNCGYSEMLSVEESKEFNLKNFGKYSFVLTQKNIDEYIKKEEERKIQEALEEEERKNRAIRAEAKRKRQLKEYRETQLANQFYNEVNRNKSTASNKFSSNKSSSNKSSSRSSTYEDSTWSSPSYSHSSSHSSSYTSDSYTSDSFGGGSSDGGGSSCDF